MKLNYYSGLFIILFLFSSCTSFNNISEKEEKIDLSTNKLKKEANCPNFHIPAETKFLLNRKKEKVIKIRGVKLECKAIPSEKDKKIVINQTIYYQVLKNKVRLNKSNTFIYIALVNENNNSIKAKVLSKVKIADFKKIDGNIYFKNNYNFKINNNEKNKNLTFYYGFQK